MQEHIKYFTILGERCSGTHFVKFSMISNFKIEYLDFDTVKYIPKKIHFFGHDEDIYNHAELDKTIYICVIRDPVEWIDSFFKRLHHVPEENKKNVFNFLTKKFYSIYEDGPKKNTEIMEDRNIITKEQYKNIFELRKVKCNYFFNVVQNKVKHFLLLKYEDLRDDYDNTLELIKNKFNLIKKTDEYLKIIKYKGTYNALYFKKPILLTKETQEYIKTQLDLEQEKKLGYLLDN